MARSAGDERSSQGETIREMKHIPPAIDAKKRKAMQKLHTLRLFEGGDARGRPSLSHYAFQLREWMIEPSAAMMKQR